MRSPPPSCLMPRGVYLRGSRAESSPCIDGKKREGAMETVRMGGMHKGGFKVPAPASEQSAPGTTFKHTSGNVSN